MALDAGGVVEMRSEALFGRKVVGEQGAPALDAGTGFRVDDARGEHVRVPLRALMDRLGGEPGERIRAGSRPA
jgi:hypothetical protein